MRKHIFFKFLRGFKKRMHINAKSGLLYYLGKYLLKLMFVFVYRCKSHGQENIPKDTGVIIAPNHIGFFDPPVTGCFMKRDLFFMAKNARLLTDFFD